ncbi:hypothetical protein PQU92_02585 [Asticcacaulis sp. BYS171W]|uniref:DGQHR domain-containing protein n=1 Tax=Asticcacaulis aquaticus TaxID=2984212 RepID=A0ABT5HQ04_9CAUL|nr:hypothetical protein [Asticcacaulis aquaticus]MDC7682144.1 hypothetical protein [Asticcacaulis aquaticus]
METRELRLKRLAKPGDYIMRYQETDGVGGKPPRSITFVGAEPMPLGYAELEAARLHKPVSARLDLRNARIVETDDPDLDIDSVAHIKALLESPFSSRTVSLQRGGWLPSGLAMLSGNTTILPDRNTFCEIKGRFQDGASVRQDDDFLDLLTDFQGRINPMLFAIEGNIRQIPDVDTVASQLVEAVNLIQSALPKAKPVFGPDSLRGAVGIIEDTRGGFEAKAGFLLELAPLLKNNVRQSQKDERWVDVLTAAKKHGVPRHSLVVLAALSLVVVPNAGSPATKVLKFQDAYTPADAYNTLCDLRSLELLMNLLALFPNERPAVFTADKGLARFWVGIQADNFEATAQGATYDVSPVAAIMPEPYRVRWLEDIKSAADPL